MSVQNLATVFGPNILRAKAEDPQSIMGGAITSTITFYKIYQLSDAERTGTSEHGRTETEHRTEASLMKGDPLSRWFMEQIVAAV